MKNYLHIAALLGVIAVMGVFILAQAKQQGFTPTAQKQTALSVLSVQNINETAAFNERIAKKLSDDAMRKLAALTPAAGQDESGNEKRGIKNFLGDRARCQEQTRQFLSAKTSRNATRTDEQKVFIACMTAKGHRADTITASLKDDADKTTAE